ncbi:hypothetical protein TSH7_01395 [Azospirillum sp. TSH7]|uniref:hypothetical protein n=1 Tax=unclassified Azospirillum TaxID=2630922 RepID=UPI000D60FC20|nr:MULTISPECIES: hypothetical protein [unclassified Azospirillum]PWC69127.1 hypothetical protein TSH7_01395 [Azospirillum sp. TSH7]PWC71381.1 hypothetical protein TSH20_03680 [Azospirillum sp. TSH20]
MTAAKNSTRQMHVYRGTPHCFVIGGEAEARALPIRALWAADGGASCRLHATPADSEDALWHTGGCAGCVRKLRMELIRDGKLEPHPSVKTGPLRNGVKVAA